MKGELKLSTKETAVFDLTEWLEAKFQSAENLFREHSEHISERHLSRIEQFFLTLEIRIMSALDDLTAAVTADVEGRKALAESVDEIGVAVTNVARFLTDNPTPGVEVIQNLATQLATAGTDLAASAATLHSSAVTLEGLVPASTAPTEPTTPTGAAPVETEPAPGVDPEPALDGSATATDGAAPLA